MLPKEEGSSSIHENDIIDHGREKLLDDFDRSIPAKSISFRGKKPNAGCGLGFVLKGTMARFGSAREAKEFLISRIAEQAQRDGKPLSEIERKELYFSESGWTLPDIMSVNEAFDRDYDQDSYEKKVKKLVREARIRARKEAPQDVKSWSDAIRILRKEDHYISVMLGHPTVPRHPFVDLLRATGTGLALSAMFAFVALFLQSHFEIMKTREGRAFVEWWIVTGFVGFYLLMWLILGREEASHLLGRIIEPPMEFLARILKWGGIDS